MSGLAADGPPEARFAVVRLGPGWELLHNGASRGRFDFQVDAVEMALRLAGAEFPPGQPLTILVQDRFGQLKRLST